MPQPGVEVRQHWNHYSFDGSGVGGIYGGEEDRRTGSDGEITFPERSFRTSAFRWGLATIGTPLRWINIHASTGPHSSLMCPEQACEGLHWYTGNKSQIENTILTVESPEKRERTLENTKKYEPLPNPDGVGFGPGLSISDDDESAPPPPPPLKQPANR